MKLSLSNLIDSQPFYQGWLFTVSIEKLDTINYGESIGNVFPATSVQEKLFTYQTDDVSMMNGFTVRIPKVVDYHQTLMVNFNEQEFDDNPTKLSTLMTEWVNALFNDDGSVNIEKIAKSDPTVVRKVTVNKYTKQSDGAVKVSQYLCLPPLDLDFNPSGTVDVYSSTVNMPVIKVLKKTE